MKLVHLMGGEIWVESEEGKGTRFHFTMILNAAEGKEPEPSVPMLAHDIPPQNRRCLIIDHSSMVRKLLTRDIGRIGFHPFATGDFVEADACLRLNHYAVIVVDASIPGSDTFVRSVAETSQATRVIVTAILGTVADFDAANVVTTLVKPIRRWRLFKALEKALNRSPPIKMNDIELDLAIKDMEPQRQGLASLAFRHPLRILVFLRGTSLIEAC